LSGANGAIASKVIALNGGYLTLDNTSANNPDRLTDNGRIALNASRCWVDAWAFERLASGDVFGKIVLVNPALGSATR